MSSKTNWVLQTDRSVYKFLAKISKADAEHILEVMESLRGNPFFGDIQKMKGEEKLLAKTRW